MMWTVRLQKRHPSSVLVQDDLPAVFGGPLPSVGARIIWRGIKLEVTGVEIDYDARHVHITAVAASW